MCSLLGQWKEESFIILVSWLWEGPVCNSSLPQIKILISKKIINVAIIVNKSCISSLHEFFITYWRKTPLCLHSFSCFIETRNNGQLNTQDKLHQQPRKDPVKRSRMSLSIFVLLYLTGLGLRFIFSDKLNLQFPEFVLILQPCWPLCYRECLILWTETQQYLFHKGEGGVEVLFCDGNWHRRKAKLISPILHIGVSF